ncbi:MAG TPA: hypothetical protein VIK01_15675 [Polyangiaceae bacterium]
MIVAAIPRPNGAQLVTAIAQNPRDGTPYVLLSNVCADETVTHRCPLRVSELKDVISALTLALQTLTARKPQHRTITGAELEAETRRLF